jgi:hypothetical protein
MLASVYGEATDMTLGLNSASDWGIQDDKGTVYTIEQARTAWDAGKVTDYNLAFNRLVQMGWDLDAVKAYYGKQRGR